MFDWGLFTDYHEAIPHLVFEGLTVAVPAVFGWVLGHRRHDAKNHALIQGPPGPMGPGVADVSQLTQRIERLEAGGGYTPWEQWDPTGQAGL